MTAPWPHLDSGIEVHASVADVDALWDRFEVFEAIHHSQRICNPMREAELDRLLDLIEPAPERHVVDIACGSGELLIRCHERGTRQSLGIDLSPWMLRSAAHHAGTRLVEGPAPRWLLADAARVDLEPTDTVVCLGADWIWHGMVGTVAVLASLVEPGARVVYGGPRLHFGADPDAATEQFGRLDTAAGVERELELHGLKLVERIDPGEPGWRAYLDRGSNDVAAWRKRNPGPRAEQWVADQQEWIDAYERDREVVGWSVWVADRA